MENVEVLLRGLVMQNAGMGLGSVSVQGVQLLWLVVVATVVVAVVSVTRVSYVSVGWTWGSKPGQVRVRVQSFASLLEDGIVTASGVFSAEILNCSADSCSDDASSSVAEPRPAEMLFIFDKQSLSLPSLPKQSSAPVCAAPDKIVRKRSKSLDFQKTESLPRSKSLDLQKTESLLLLSPQSIGGAVSRPVVLREGIVWDAAPASRSACGVDGLQSARGKCLINSAGETAPRLPVVKNSSWEWDPLLKLRIRDAVVSDGRSSFSVKDFTFPVAPVAIQGSSVATLGDDVVRVWDSDTRCLTKSVRLPKGGNGAVTAFGVGSGLEAVAMAREGGLVSLVNLESGAHANCYETRQPVVQAVHLDSSRFSKMIVTGGPATANPGCCVALWDSRSSGRELTLDLTSASAIHGIRSQGEELHVRDEASSLAVHDMRMLGASVLTRVPCEVTLSGAPEDRWWDMDPTFEEEDDIDDDDFIVCQTTEETKRAATSMSSLVTVMSRSFSSKALVS